ncbi:scarecrow-like protein 14-like [Dorcoceras hygrometricum]|uniref:Scarecrow-like protein 14-like n=1 Tax=Dorcoceras hygrometricum TaxID=472368 RepID=A0A2Z7D3W7_9LAMI|nr:scarecrow-like protein 14-like [Dorcoceras hygrometricum]
MDQNYRRHREPTSGIKVNTKAVPVFSDPIKVHNQAVPVFSDPNLNNGSRVGGQFFDWNVDNEPVPYCSNLDVTDQLSECDSHEDCDFSDVVLKYINHILMEEDVEEKSCMFQESAALQAAEKSFFDVLGEQQPAPAVYQQTPMLHHGGMENLDANSVEEGVHSRGVGDLRILCPDLFSESNSDDGFERRPVTVNSVSQTISQSCYSSSSSSGTVLDCQVDSPISILGIPDIFTDSQSIMQFKRGFEEASKFLPDEGNLMVDLSYDKPFQKERKEGSAGLAVKVEKNLHIEESADVSRGKKNSFHDNMGVEEARSKKQSAVYTESTVSSEMFDQVLLCSKGKNLSDLRRALDEISKKNTANVQSKGLNSGKTQGKKSGSKRNVVDMRTLLTLCAQAVAADDRRTANEFLKQIREHATPTGDGMQRLAHYFADGLEARMAGSGTQIYKSLLNIPTSAADILKAYHIYLATCPFRKTSNFFANKTIMNVAAKATKLHIIDFGILYGFQWPCFLQRLSSRPGGPPKLRITGIDFPCPGFRPSQRVEETGRRLENYARTFNIPFEFNAIAQKWETIKLKDLKINKDETLVVNSLYRLRNLLDETVIVNSPRNIVINLIREMNPTVFVQGIMNGAFNAPFFITRFREALFHYSSFFDMLDANIPRECHERMLLEKTIFGREAMNVIACEAAERIERPETYKQWQARCMRAGFEQLPLDKEIKKTVKDKVESFYNKDFVIDEDCHWMLQGWKGRIVYALTTWKPS